MKKLILIVVSSVLLVGLGGWYLVKEADAAGPGDLLYSIDIAAESVERFLTFDEVAEAELEEDILDERVDELETLIETEEIDEDLVLRATEDVDTQRSRVQQRLEIDEDSTGTMEQVQNRYEEQVQEHVKVMEQVQEKVEGEETQNKVKETVSNYQNSVDDSTGENGNSTGGKGNN